MRLRTGPGPCTSIFARPRFFRLTACNTQLFLGNEHCSGCLTIRAMPQSLRASCVAVTGLCLGCSTGQTVWPSPGRGPGIGRRDCSVRYGRCPGCKVPRGHPRRYEFHEPIRIARQPEVAQQSDRCPSRRPPLRIGRRLLPTRGSTDRPLNWVGYWTLATSRQVRTMMSAMWVSSGETLPGWVITSRPPEQRVA